MAPGGPVVHEHGHGMGAAAATYISKDENVQIASAGKDGRIKIWSLSAEPQRQSDDMDCDGPMHSIAVSPDARIIAVGTDQSILVSTPFSRVSSSICRHQACCAQDLRFHPSQELNRAAIQCGNNGVHTNSRDDPVCCKVTVVCSDWRPPGSRRRRPRPADREC